MGVSNPRIIVAADPTVILPADPPEAADGVLEAAGLDPGHQR